MLFQQVMNIGFQPLAIIWVSLIWTFNNVGLFHAFAPSIQLLFGVKHLQPNDSLQKFNMNTEDDLFAL